MDEELLESGWFYIAFGLFILWLSRIKGTNTRRVATVRGKVTSMETDEWLRSVHVQFYLYGEYVTKSFPTTREYIVGDPIDVMYDPFHPSDSGIKEMPKSDPRLWWMPLLGLGILKEAHRIWLWCTSGWDFIFGR